MKCAKLRTEKLLDSRSYTVQGFTQFYTSMHVQQCLLSRNCADVFKHLLNYTWKLYTGLSFQIAIKLPYY